MRNIYVFPYLDAQQSQSHATTDWESDFADAIENAFGNGCHELGTLIPALNQSRVRPPMGGQWTEEIFTALMRELGA